MEDGIQRVNRDVINAVDLWLWALLTLSFAFQMPFIDTFMAEFLSLSCLAEEFHASVFCIIQSFPVWIQSTIQTSGQLV